MFILRRGNLTLGVRTGYILPKQPLSPLICAQFETFSKQQRSQEPGFNLEKKTEVLPKYCQNFYLPMGTKKSVFLHNKSIERKSKPVLRPPLNQKMDLALSLSRSPDSIESTLSKRSSKIIIPRHFKFDAPLVKMTSIKPEEKKPPKPKANLELISYQLTQDLTNIFMKKQEWGMYHPEMVFVDNIRGQ